jgi:hypothetical protein
MVKRCKLKGEAIPKSVREIMFSVSEVVFWKSYSRRAFSCW